MYFARLSNVDGYVWANSYDPGVDPPVRPIPYSPGSIVEGRG